MDWVKIHRWLVNNLEQTLFQAEMHRVNMQQHGPGGKKGIKLRLIEGGKLQKYPNAEPTSKKIRKAL